MACGKIKLFDGQMSDIVRNIFDGQVYNKFRSEVGQESCV